MSNARQRTLRLRLPLGQIIQPRQMLVKGGFGIDPVQPGLQRHEFRSGLALRQRVAHRLDLAGNVAPRLQGLPGPVLGRDGLGQGRACRQKLAALGQGKVRTLFADFGLQGGVGTTGGQHRAVQFGAQAPDLGQQRRMLHPQGIAVGPRHRAIQPCHDLACHHHVAGLDQQLAQGGAAHRLQDDGRGIGGQTARGGDDDVDAHHRGNRHQRHDQPRAQQRPKAQDQRRRLLHQPVEIGLKLQRCGGDHRARHDRCSVCWSHRWR